MLRTENLTGVDLLNLLIQQIRLLLINNIAIFQNIVD